MTNNDALKSGFFSRIKLFFARNRQIFLLLFLYVTLFLFITTATLVILTRPDGEARVPALVGEKFVMAYSQLYRADISPEIKFYDVYDIEDGIILSQSPQAGEVIAKGTRLHLVISRNNTKIEVPALVGKQLSLAKNKLKNLHVGEKTVSLRTGVISYMPSSEHTDNVIIAQNPREGEKISPEQKVNLLVSAGDVKEEMKMPSLVGQSIDICYDLLLAKGVRVSEEIVPVNSKARSGLILSQKPYRRAAVGKGETVSLKIGYFPVKEHYYRGYELVTYVLPEDAQPGVYEAYVEDHSPRRVRFYGVLKGGNKLQFIFYRNGNAKIEILKDKKAVKSIVLNVDNFD